jgi:hypothetical protein
MENNMTREQMIDSLREGLCEVTFEKKDGTMRVMPCTLKSDLIPSDMMPKGGEDSLREGLEKTISAIRVYAPESEGWRSFIVDNVKDFKLA